MTAETWTDDEGVTRKVPQGKRLAFKSAGHAALRRFVFRRDAFACARCGLSPVVAPAGYDGRKTVRLPGDSNWLDLDHKMPRAKGGGHHPDNLQPMCWRCNSGKCDRVMP